MARHRWATSPPEFTGTSGALALRTAADSRGHPYGLEPADDPDGPGVDHNAGGRRRWAVGRGTALLVLGLVLTLAAGMLFLRGGPTPEITSVALDAGAGDGVAAPAAAESATESATGTGSGTGTGSAAGTGTGAGTGAGTGLPAAPLEETPPADAALPVLVHVAGAVTNPGVVELTAGARVFEALELAGGALPDADLSAINLAAPVQDGLQVRVPVAGEAVTPVPAAGSEAMPGPDAPAGSDTAAGGGTGGSVPVNINTAELQELDTLPRIGPVLAERIIQWRTEHGAFTSPEGLDAVPGIGEAMLAALVPLVTV